MLVACLRTADHWVIGCIGLELRRAVGAEGRDLGIINTGLTFSTVGMNEIA